MKFLIVGLGSIGGRHYNNLIALGINQVGVFRSRLIDPPVMLEKEPDHVFSDFSKALEWEPDAVVIANPTSLHLDFARRAVENGSHVYLEKPVSDSPDGVDDLLRLEKKKGVKILVGCQLRFHPNLIRIKEWLSNDLAGKIYSVSVDMGEYLPGWHPWEDYRESYASRDDLGGGVILTQIHDIDYLFWLFGPMSRVFGIGGKKTSLEISVEDTALLLMETRTDIPLQLRMDYWRNPPVRRMNIVGEKGEISWDYFLGKAVLQSKGEIVQTSDIPESWDRNDMFLSAMSHFLDVVAERQEPLIPLSDGYEVLKIAAAAKRSIMGGKVSTL